LKPNWLKRLCLGFSGFFYWHHSLCKFT